MHLLSFYSTPYSAKNREEFYTKKLNTVRLVWLSLGVIVGLALNFLVDRFDGDGDYRDVAVLEQEDTKVASVKPDEEIAQQPSSSLTAEQKLDALMRGEDPESIAAQQQQNAALAPVEKDKPEWPKQRNLEVQSGDTLISILLSQGIDHVAAHRLSKQINETYSLKQLRPGHALELTLNKAENTDDVVDADSGETLNDDTSTGEASPQTLVVEKLELFINKLETLEAVREAPGAYAVEIIKKKLTTTQARAKAHIKDSLYNAVDAKGMPQEAIVKVIKNFSYDIDFQRDIRVGDMIDVMYQARSTEDGEVVAAGDVLYAHLKTGGKHYKHYLFDNEEGIPNYYNEHGESIVKKLLKTPVDGARLSSSYGLRRHPILGYTKMHRGVDFAAASGTPIFAAGDGVVVFSGRHGGYGNFVKIKHNSTYSTAYAHAKKIHPNAKKGMKVKQGQIIAYVGTTGRSTGPHLHYEIYKNGKHVNPLHVKFTGGNKLKGKQLASFKEHVRTIHHELARLEAEIDGQTKLAYNKQ